MTPIQLRAFEFIRERIAELGVAPRQCEIAEELGISTARANVIEQLLVAEGVLEKARDGRRRSLRVVGEPDLRLVSTSRLQSELARRGITFESLDTGTRRAFARGAVTCAADSCGNEVQRGRLFCLTHWRALPERLRHEILAAHRHRDRDAFQDAVGRARDIADGCGGVL